MMGIEEQKEGAIDDRVPLSIADIRRLPVQQDADTAGKPVFPFFVVHLLSKRVDPHHVLDAQTAYRTSLEKFRTAKNSVILSKLDHLGDIIGQLLLLGREFPGKPADTREVSCPYRSRRYWRAGRRSRGVHA